MNFSDLLRRMAAEFATSQLFSVLSSAFGGSTGAFAKFAGSMFGGARANGGPMQRGKGYLINEGKPEVYFPGMSGSMVPVANMAGGGDQNFYLTQHFAGGPTPDAARQGAELLRLARADSKYQNKRRRLQ